MAEIVKFWKWTFGEILRTEWARWERRWKNARRKVSLLKRVKEVPWIPPDEAWADELHELGMSYPPRAQGAELHTECGPIHRDPRLHSMSRCYIAPAVDGAYTPEEAFGSGWRMDDHTREMYMHSRQHRAKAIQDDTVKVSQESIRRAHEEHYRRHRVGRHRKEDILGVWDPSSVQLIDPILFEETSLYAASRKKVNLSQEELRKLAAKAMEMRLQGASC